MVFFKRPERGTTSNPHSGKFIINPTLTRMYVDTDGTSCEVSSDIILKHDYRWNRCDYSIILPGFLEWVQRYRNALDAVNNQVDPSFDWGGWHRDGLLFAKELFRRLPRHIIVRYVIPIGDDSGLIEDFDLASEEQVDSIITQLDYGESECEPVFVDTVVVGVKQDDDCICVRFKTKGKSDSFTFYLDHEGILLLKDFLERIAISENTIVAWESKTSENGMYLYPQTIGDFKNMYQLHIFSEKELAFSAYVNVRDFVRSVYKSIMTNIGGMRNLDVSRIFQSSIVECFIDDNKYEHISFFRRFPKLAGTVGPAIENVKKYFHDIYESILDDSEYV
jgi:hypothetical protein